MTFLGGPPLDASPGVGTFVAVLPEVAPAEAGATGTGGRALVLPSVLPSRAAGADTGTAAPGGAANCSRASPDASFKVATLPLAPSAAFRVDDGFNTSRGAVPRLKKKT